MKKKKKKNRRIHLREIFLFSSFAFRRMKLAMIQRNTRYRGERFRCSRRIIQAAAPQHRVKRNAVIFDA